VRGSSNIGRKHNGRKTNKNLSRKHPNNRTPRGGEEGNVTATKELKNRYRDGK
jgi:hypothetical protein